MPAPAWKAAGAWVSAASGTVSPAWPAGHAAGDIGLLIVETNSWPVNIPTRSGFRMIPWSPQKHGSPAGFSSGLTVYWCRASSGAMPNPVIEVPGNRAYAAIITFSGVGVGGVPWTVGTGRRMSNSASVSFPSVTTPEADNLIVHIMTNQGFRTGSGWANGALTGVTERVDTFDDDAGVIVVTGVKASAGATGNTTGTLSTSANQTQIVIALSPNAQAEDKSPDRGLAGAIVESASGNVTPVWPVHEAGDIGLLICEGGDGNISLASAEGFVELDISPKFSGSGVSQARLHVFWKRATSAAEPNPTVAFGANHLRACILTIKDALSSGDPFEAKAGENQAASTTLTWPSVTTFVNDCLVIVVGTTSNDDSSKSYIDNWANSMLEGITEWVDDVSTIGDGGGIFVATGRMKTAGAVGSVTAGISGGSTFKALMTLALEGRSLEHKTFQMDTGSFALNGQPAGILRSRLLNALTGEFSVSGQDATFPIHLNRLFPAAVGSFILSGGDVTFTKRLVNWSKESEVEGSWVKEAPLD